ncbi:hypothetical protein [Methylocaldum sp. RMAD-M]|jgi:hypothetical protein|uniref:hypothetical protein n=1 Tax=Methylocaldum sp. RMAD-M TaxID=2806557 RepID=UPI001AE5F7F5|nr:hypothetical protein [Methylocaldum sp. RMAD-M]MBP1151807.1 hypothetical protein [Methylocaldum sp. RMAD-M]
MPKNVDAVFDFMAALPPDRWLLVIVLVALGVVVYALHVHCRVVETLTKKGGN